MADRMFMLYPLRLTVLEVKHSNTVETFGKIFINNHKNVNHKHTSFYFGIIKALNIFTVQIFLLNSVLVTHNSTDIVKADIQVH